MEGMNKMKIEEKKLKPKCEKRIKQALSLANSFHRITVSLEGIQFEELPMASSAATITIELTSLLALLY